MPLIHLQTIIEAPRERCFDLSRSIDLHLISTRHTGEQVIGGRSEGLIALHESVTWKARHLGIWQIFSSVITSLQYPQQFTDEMTKGAFRSFRHDHFFRSADAHTLMEDRLFFESPLGILGVIANRLLLVRHLTTLLLHRNQVIKEYAESEKWKEIIPGI